MHIESVEIYSDAPNAAVMRHPGRKFPGVLIQGDTLNSMCRLLGSAATHARSKLDADIFDELDEVRRRLQSLLTHYKAVLGEHHLPLPFPDGPGS